MSFLNLARRFVCNVSTAFELLSRDLSFGSGCTIETRTKLLGYIETLSNGYLHFLQNMFHKHIESTVCEIVFCRRCRYISRYLYTILLRKRPVFQVQTQPPPTRVEMLDASIRPLSFGFHRAELFAENIIPSMQVIPT